MKIQKEIVLWIVLTIVFWWLQVSYGVQQHYPLWLSISSAISTSIFGWLVLRYCKKKGII